MSFGGGDRFDVLNGDAVYGEITVGTTAVEVKVGGSPLADRRMVHITPKDNQVFWGYDSSVTTSTGTRVWKEQTVFLPVGPDISIYLIANDAGKTVSIAELA